MVEHPGAVMVLAVDDEEQVCCCASTGTPAGGCGRAARRDLATQGGEDPQVTAARELQEEAELRAEHWQLVTGAALAPGISAERHLIYLARGLSRLRAAASRCTEEAEMRSSGCPSRTCSRPSSRAGSGRVRWRPPCSPTTS